MEAAVISLRAVAALVTAAVLIVPALDAQVGIGDPEGERSQLEELRRRVPKVMNLTPEQEGDLKLLHRDLQQELEAIRDRVADGDLTNFEGREEYTSAMRVHQLRRNAILTEAQHAIMQRTWRHLRKLELNDGRREEEKSFTRLADELDLSDEQKIQWYGLLQVQRLQFQEIMEAMEVGEEERDETEIVRTLRNKHILHFRQLLSFEQVEQFEAIRRDWDEHRRRAAFDDDLAEGFIENNLFDDQFPADEEFWDDLEPDRFDEEFQKE